MINMKKIKEQKFLTKVIMNLLSAFIFSIIFVLLGFVGIENPIYKLVIILIFAWVGFFVFPIFFVSKYVALLFVRFMKDAPLLFPTFLATMFLQPILIGPFSKTSSGGVALTEFNYGIIILIFTCIVIFATNVHLITKFLLTKKWFKNIISKLRIQVGRKKLFANGLEQEISTGDIKSLTYLIMMVQVFPIVFISIIPMFIFQEIIVIPALVKLFGSLIFFSAGLMAIAVIKSFTLSYESVIKSKWGK